jgi:ABC-2 type transport system permease protein
LGKIIRFSFFITFLIFLVRGADNLAGYSVNQTIFFFLTFNLIDIVTQFFFREVYRFRSLLVSGDFDLVLTKPLSGLFRVLVGGSDVIDLLTIPPLIIAIIYVGKMLDPSLLNVTYYILLIINAFIIATAFHIAILAFGIITLEVDHTIWIYRDLTNLGRFPIDIYKQPLRVVITYLIPVGLMISLPVKALLGLVSPMGVLSSFIFGVAAIYVSGKFWNFSLRKYTSASK